MGIKKAKPVEAPVEVEFVSSFEELLDSAEQMPKGYHLSEEDMKVIRQKLSTEG